MENLNRVSSDLRRWRDSAKAATELASDVDSLLDSMATADLPEIEDSLANVFRDAGMAESETDLRAHWDRVRDFLSSAKDELHAAKIVTQSITGILEAHERVVRVQVDRELAAHGLDGARINQLQALNVQASLLGSYQANFNQVRNALAAADGSFEMLRAERHDLVDQQRDAFDRVIETVHLQFDGQIAARRINDGRKESLDRYFRELSQRGITRWWNDLTDEQRPTPDDLLEKLHADHLEDVWMSEAVQETFLVQLTPSKRRELASLRCRDRYVLEFKMGDGSYRVLDYLSGGQQGKPLTLLALGDN